MDANTPMEDANMNASWKGKITLSAEYKEEKLANLGGEKIPVVETGEGLYAVSHDVSEISTEWNKTEYRYAGANPNNYVQFNNEIWRIIGLVNVKTDSGVEQRVKIVRQDKIEGQKDFGNYAWDRDEYFTNNWTTSKLKDMLNGIYYESGTGECYTGTNDDTASQNICDFNTGTDLPKGLDDTARNMIDKEVIWNIGGCDSASITTNQFYERERGTSIGGSNTYPIEWSRETDEGGKHNGIGLIYPSDYGYSVGGEVRNNCLTKKLYDYNEDDCPSNDWLKPNNKLLTLSLYSYNSDNVFGVSSSGFVSSYYYADNAIGVWPVGYLTSSTKIVDGNGTIDEPFNLQIVS